MRRGAAGSGRPGGVWWWTGGAVTALVVLAAAFGVIGADSYWLVALGDRVLGSGSVPAGVPFAAAPTSGWPNVLVAAEVVFAAFAGLGPAGLLTLQLLADAGALVLVALGARRLGAGDRSTALVLLVVGLGASSALVVVRLQLLSLVPFALLLLLLRRQHARPSGHVWLLALLFAVWSNLHGAVLVGVAVTGCYLLCSRLPRDPWTALGVGVASLLAVWLTPATWRTGSYYLGVLTNEAARRGSDLWSRPSVHSPFDVLMVLCGVLLLALALRRRLPTWEYVAMAGLAVATATSARHGLWLLLLAAAPAAAHLARLRSRTPSTFDGATGWARTPRAVAGAAAGGLVAAVLVAVVVAGRGATALTGVDPALVRSVQEVSHGGVVLAEEPLVELLAARGLTVWVSDPLDAFTSRDQAAYLDFLSGVPGARRALDHADVVVVDAAGDPATSVAKDPRFALVRRVGGWLVYSR